MKKLLAILSLFFCMTVTLMAQQVVTTWLSDAVVPGEQTRLFIILTDGSIARQTRFPGKARQPALGQPGQPHPLAGVSQPIRLPDGH